MNSVGLVKACIESFWLHPLNQLGLYTKKDISQEIHYVNDGISEGHRQNSIMYHMVNYWLIENPVLKKETFAIKFHANKGNLLLTIHLAASFTVIVSVYFRQNSA